MSRQNTDRYVPPQRPGNEQPPYTFGGPKNDGSSRVEFSFRAGDHYSNVNFSQDQPPRGPRAQRGRRQDDIRPGGLRSGTQRQQEGQTRGRRYRAKPAVSERPLLLGQRSPTPEQLAGMAKPEARFKAVQDLSDSDEEEMDLGSDDGELNGHSHDDKPVRKKVATGDNLNFPSGQQSPKWSNPDPYTSLPPLGTIPGKKRDFVSLIRKARADEEKGDTSMRADEGDFISFGADSESDEEETKHGLKGEKKRKPKEEQNKSDKANTKHGATKPEPSETHKLPPKPVQSAVSPALPPNPNDAPPKPPRQVVETIALIGGQRVDVWPPPSDSSSLPAQPSGNDKPDRKNRKRTRHQADNEADSTSAEDPSERTVSIVGEWRTRDLERHTPWYTIDHSTDEVVASRFHKEICDFFDYLRPREFENRARLDLVERLQTFLNAKQPGAEVHPFGSFAAGLYLPDGDMDLVVLSQDFIGGGEPALCTSKKGLYKFANTLKFNGIPKIDSLCVIPFAKVPLIKYVDNHTGLRVDISFENGTGLVANDTYAMWKVQHKAMPVLVTLVKQLLHMRGLDDVSTGGLGGFAVTCLVISLLQHLPQNQSGNMDPMTNLGELFMEFLDLYGNKFNTMTTAIQIDPPAYVPKYRLSQGLAAANRPNLLVILDPNNPSNNISRSTSNIDMVRRVFSEAYQSLRRHMSELASGTAGTHPGGILGSVYAGNYAGFEAQRQRLKDIPVLSR